MRYALCLALLALSTEAAAQNNDPPQQEKTLEVLLAECDENGEDAEAEKPDWCYILDPAFPGAPALGPSGLNSAERNLDVFILRAAPQGAGGAL